MSMNFSLNLRKLLSKLNSLYFNMRMKYIEKVQKAQKFPSNKVQSSRISGKNFSLICKSFNYEKIRNSEFPENILIILLMVRVSWYFVVCVFSTYTQFSMVTVFAISLFVRNLEVYFFYNFGSLWKLVA